MNKETLVRKMEEGVTSVRDLLNENDGSTIQAINKTVKQGFKSLKVGFTENERAQAAMAELKSKFEELEEAVISGDKKLSGKILAAVEKRINKFKAKESSSEKKKTPALPAGEKETKKKPTRAKKTTAKKSAAPKTANPEEKKAASTKKTDSSKKSTAAKKKTTASTSTDKKKTS